MPPKFALVFTIFCVGCATGGTLPSAAIDHNTAGAELLAAGQLDDAQSRFHLALEYHPHFSEAHANLGVVEMQRGHFAKAKEYFLSAIRLNEDFAEAWSNLGVVYEQLGKQLDAKQAYISALAIDPGMTNARRNVSRLHILRGEFREARAHLMRLVQIEPQNVRSQSLLAYAEVRLERPEAGEARANKILAANPTHPIALVARAIARMHRSEFQQAIEDLKPAIHDELVGFHARIRLATCLVTTHQAEQAHIAIEALVASHPQHPAVRLLAGYQALAEGNRELASKHARAALKISPDLEAAQKLLRTSDYGR